MKYRTIPAEVEAFQIDSGFFDLFVKDKAAALKQQYSLQTAVAMPDSYVEHVSTRLYIEVKDGKRVLFVRTSTGDQRAALGDWVVIDSNGLVCICKPDVFAATYEAVV